MSKLIRCFNAISTTRIYIGSFYLFFELVIGYFGDAKDSPKDFEEELVLQVAVVWNLMLNNENEWDITLAGLKFLGQVRFPTPYFKASLSGLPVLILPNKSVSYIQVLNQSEAVTKKGHN